jgi:hypothetical protein
MTHPELLAALKAATGPSRELDTALAATFGECDPTTEYFTSSIDAALALVERTRPGCGWHVSTQDDGYTAWLELIDRDVIETAPTAPLAILIALMTALEANHG